MKLARWIMAGVFVLVIIGVGVKEWRGSQLVNQPQGRFNLVMIRPGSELSFVSFDKTEKSLIMLQFPNQVSINARNSGVYDIASLYNLGEYQGSGGEFAARKVQGFMRVPVPGYLVLRDKTGQAKSILRKGLWKTIIGRSETNLSRFDAALLWYRAINYREREIGEEELIRAAVIEKEQDKMIYHPERLQDYVGTRFFDWRIGEEGVTVAIINASGVDGLGSDMADFLTNLGMDVLMVRSEQGDRKQTKSRWQVGNEKQVRELNYIFQNLFDFGSPKVEEVGEEYRAEVLVIVGEDAKELF
ncbi:MAG: LytR C-terminal domain-containing protein [bacterium]